MESIISANVIYVSLFEQLAVASVRQFFGIRVAMDSLQHEAYNEIYTDWVHFTITRFSLFHEMIKLNK